MADAIDFYFDFSSPYGYCMSEKIDALAAAHGRTVSWRPILLGVVYKTTGAAPLPQVPLSPERAYLRYLVESPQLGPMPGVTLSGPAFGVTGLDGVYRSYTAAQGAFVTLGNLPAECTDPGLLILLPLAPREIRTTGVTLDCSN